MQVHTSAKQELELIRIFQTPLKQSASSVLVTQMISDDLPDHIFKVLLIGGEYSTHVHTLISMIFQKYDLQFSQIFDHYKFAIFFVLGADAGVGKSSIIIRFVDNTFSESISSTIGASKDAIFLSRVHF
jgi:hypothetical protein